MYCPFLLTRRVVKIKCLILNVISCLKLNPSLLCSNFDLISVCFLVFSENKTFASYFEIGVLFRNKLNIVRLANQNLILCANYICSNCYGI